MNQSGIALMGKVALVTGATGGIGKETARGLAAQGASVVLIARDKTRGEQTVAEIRETTGNAAVTGLYGDLSSVAEIRRLVEAFLAQHDTLDILVNNVGGYFHDRQESPDGVEMIWATNFLPTFLITNLLLEALRKSPEGRVINVSSLMMASALTLKDTDPQVPFNGFRAYAEAKLAVSALTMYQAERLRNTSVTVNALHPGAVATDLFWKSLPKWWPTFLNPLVQKMLVTPARAAQNSIRLATLKGQTGKYFVEAKEQKAKALAYDRATQEKVWALGEKWTGQKFDL